MTAGNQSNWSRFWKLPRFEQKNILYALIFLPLTKAGLRWIGFRRCKELIERLSPVDEPRPVLESGNKREIAERITRAAALAERYGPGKPNCLVRSLVLWWLLRRQGIDGELHVGARKNESRFEAHAWVELRGIILNDSADVHEHYSRFDAPIAAVEAGTHDSGEAASR
jgi:hypothetical protein